MVGYNILIVDNSATIRTVVKRIISMIDVEVTAFHEAANGLEALTALDEHWIDLVFCDINMPEMNGMELVATMAERQLMETIPVVMVSSDRSKQRHDELMRHGIRAFITKPFRPETFRDIVHDIMGTGAGCSPAVGANREQDTTF